jgi:hypothetical protein
MEKISTETTEVHGILKHEQTKSLLAFLSVLSAL